MVKIDNLSAKLKDEFNLYSEEITNQLKKIVTEEAKALKNNIVKDSPKKTGDYAKSWTTKKEENANEISILIYNKKKPGLIHLLEFGHALKSGGRTKAYPHILNNEKIAKEKIIERTKEALKKWH